MSTLACATLFAWREAGSFDLAAFALTLPAVLLVDMGTTAFDSFFDFRRGVDDGSLLSEPDKVLATEDLDPGAALLVALSCFGLAALLGLGLAAAKGIWVVGTGALCLAAGFFYSGGPAPLSRGPFGELFAGGFLGSALFMIAYRLQSGFWDGAALLASLPGALAIAAILAVNNACDAVGDAAAGRRTLAILAGPRLAAAVPSVLIAAAFALQAALSLRGALPAAASVSAVVAFAASIPLQVGMLRRGFSHGAKGRNMRSILAVFSLFSLGFLAGLAWPL